MTCSDAQVRLIMKERQQGRTQTQAAVKANVTSRKTVARYEKLGKLPSELKRPRQYRTRTDPFADDWPAVENMLQQAPELEAKTLFEWLAEQHLGKYQDGQLRTFQRRIADWRALHQEQTAILEQVHHPGEVLQTDGVWLTKLGITIAGEPFKHLLIHSVLPYSNWEWGVIAQSESLLSYRRGLQATLFQLGAVPKYHQTDNSSAVTFRVNRTGERACNPAYVQLLAHFGLKPRTIHLGRPEENGDIEAANGSLKRALAQHLLLRGSRDFPTLAAYQQFLAQVLTRRNHRRQARLAEELTVMSPLTATPLTTYREVRVKVNRAGLIRVQNNSYSVPTGLLGHQVSVHIYEWQLKVYYRRQLVETLPHLVGQKKQHINYRHLIHSLLRKPGGFRRYRYRDALFPTPIFRLAWEQLQRWYTPRKADLIYLRVLHLAAHHRECDVAVALTTLVAAGDRWDETAVHPFLQYRPHPRVPQLTVPVVDLHTYDRLLQGGRYDHA